MEDEVPATVQSGRGRSRTTSTRGQVEYGFCKVRGSRHAMEDYHVAEFRSVNGHELGLYAIYDGHTGRSVPSYLERNLFDNIVNESDFWDDPRKAIRRAYNNTDRDILDHIGAGGSTAVTASLVDGRHLLVANVGDSRAVVSWGGEALQLSVDHEPNKPSERDQVESKGGHITQRPGGVPRVDGHLAMARAFGDKDLKNHISVDPDIRHVLLDDDAEFLILASDGLWKVMDSQEAVDNIRSIHDPVAAAKHLANEAISRNSKDDISCIVVHLQQQGIED